MAKISDSFEVHKLDDLQLKGLWVLDKLSDSKDRLSSVEIADYLIEECGISTSRQAITYALEKEGGIVHKNKGGYKLMEAGRKKFAAGNSNSVIVIESGKPFSTKNVIVKDIFNNLRVIKSVIIAIAIIIKSKNPCWFNNSFSIITIF